MTGSLAIIGLGPGDPTLCAPAASAALQEATDLIGYRPYLDRVLPCPSQERHDFDNGSELARAIHALELAQSGRRVAVVSGGDPGVFAMASAVFEAIEQGPQAWRRLDVQVIPGISALLAVAAALGAPLGGDFCAISLSDNRKPWDLVKRRLRLAAKAEFAIALYNARSIARPWQLDEALGLLRNILPDATPVAFAQAVTRPASHIRITRLADAMAADADMRTLVLIGSRHTRWIERPDAPPWLYTPRSVS